LTSKHAGDWIELGSADEKKPAKDGTVKLGAVLKKIPLKVGMVLKKVYVEDLECMFRH